MEIKTSELTDAALDWAVCIAEYGYGADYKTNRYSTDWAQGGPIIERQRIFVRPKTTGGWRCWIYDGKGDGIKFDQSGPTPLIAAMRCFVSSKLGDTVDVPEELTHA